MKLYECLEYQVSDRIATLTLNRPGHGNALTDVLIIELKDAVLSAEKDPEVKSILIRAKGEHFCLGLDVGYLQQIGNYNLEQNMADSSSLAQLLFTVYRSTKVVIAQVRGDVVGDACGLVSACDFVFVDETARLGTPEAKMGMVPALSMIFLLRKIGETRAKELMLSGDMIDAHRAVQYQLVNRVIPANELEGYVGSFSRRLCDENSSASLQLIKKMTADIQDFPLESAVTFAAKMNAYSRVAPDSKRGIDAAMKQIKLQW